MLSVITSILGIVVVVNLAMFFFQPGMVFFPYRSLSESPADWGLEYEDVFLRTADDMQLHGWYIPHRHARQTLLFFHGNAGNISHRGDSIKIFHRLGLNVLIIDYRGYGRSQGRPSEKGLYADAHSAWQYLIQERMQPRQNIIIFGRSLGGAVAVQLAAEVQPGGLILESVFSSARDIAHALLPGLSRIIWLRFNFDNKEVIKQVYSPLLILHSPDDEIIPFTSGQRVFNAANRPKQFIQLQGSHNSGFLQSQPDYERHLENFLLTLDSAHAQ